SNLTTLLKTFWCAWPCGMSRSGTVCGENGYCHEATYKPSCSHAISPASPQVVHSRAVHDAGPQMCYCHCWRCTCIGYTSNSDHNIKPNEMHRGLVFFLFFF
uniref:Uncharacterized protein n=1 Tax=Xiphophorus maculatus TaxID=8083 RepID=A0A3B5Q5F7_XIPMA